MLPLPFEHFAVRAERAKYRNSLGASDAGQHGFLFSEAARGAGLAAGRLGEVFEGELRRGSLGFEQRFMDGLDGAETMHLVAAHFEKGHLRELTHFRAVSLDAFLDGAAGRGFLMT